jgi:hypothetical protein
MACVEASQKRQFKCSIDGGSDWRVTVTGTKDGRSFVLEYDSLKDYSDVPPYQECEANPTQCGGLLAPDTQLAGR